MNIERRKITVGTASLLFPDRTIRCQYILSYMSANYADEQYISVCKIRRAVDEILYMTENCKL